MELTFAEQRYKGFLWDKTLQKKTEKRLDLKVLFHRVEQINSLRKPAPPQNRLLLLTKTRTWRFWGGVDFLKLINEYIL